jgi:predicted PurR-regulated permease PerM
MDERRPFLLIAWALLLGFFAWSVRPVLTPLVLFVALAYLLAPLFGTATYRRLLITIGTLTFLWLLYVAGSVLAPFVLAFVFAYVANPVVERLERKGMGRGWGAALLILIVALVIALALVLLVPLVMHQGQQFLEDLPRMIDETLAWYRAQMAALAASRLPVIQDIAFERAMDVSSDDVSAWIAENVSTLRPSWETAVGLGQGIQAAVTILGYLVLTPVLTFYLLRDFPGMKRWLTAMLPEDRREALLTFARRYDALLGEYLRGQLLVAMFVGVATGVGFWVVGFPNAVLLGVIAGVFNLVPYLGLVVSLVPALFMAIVTPPLWLSLLKLVGVFFTVQALEGYVLSPRIIGERVGLHPVWVMFAIIAGGSFFGIVGLLLAIPIAVLIKLLVRTTLARYKSSVYYREANAVPEDTA